MLRDLTFDAWFRARYSQTVERLTRLLGDRATAEDVAAEAFARALVRWSRLSESNYQDAWVTRVAVNLGLDILRRRSPVIVVEEARTDSELVELRMVLRQALRSLPKKQREAVALRYLMGLAPQEVARTLDVSLNTATRPTSAGGSLGCELIRTSLQNRRDSMSSQPTDDPRTTEQALDAVYVRAGSLRRRDTWRRAGMASATIMAVALVIAVVVLTSSGDGSELATGNGADGESMPPATDLPARDLGEVLPLLPEDQRKLWLASWDRMRDCMAARGFEIPAAPASFGDGNTPPPAIQQGSPEFEAALAECPLDLAGVDKEALAAAVAAATEGLTHQTLDAETCEKMRSTPYVVSDELLTEAEKALQANAPELYNQFATSDERREYIRSEMNAGHDQALSNSGC